MTKKARKMLPYTLKWEKLANQEARNFAPEIYPCKHCGYPTLHGYCCNGCGAGDPT